MSDYKRLTNQEWNDKIDLTQEYGYQHIYKRLWELENKIEQGTLVEISEVAKLFNKLWECPCDYIFDDQDVNELICKNVEEDWCEKNCPTEWYDYTKCWEQYIKVKLKELKGEV